MRTISLFLAIISTSISLQAGYTLREGRLIDNEKLATLSVQEHYSAAMDAYQKNNWDELVHQSRIITENFPATPFAQESIFYLGVGYFHQKEYELANKQFSNYLKKYATPKHFEEAIQFKYSIADKFQHGAKKHILGWKDMPKIVPADEDALNIYEEVITALPHDELAAKALFGKAQLLFKEEEYKASIEAYQTLIRRFPKNSFAAESYLGIAEVYLSQCRTQYPDPDFLDLAEINLKKFRQDFPREEKVESAEKMLVDMQEVYAESLYETGQFFERTKKPHASIIYYNKILGVYPKTKAAALSENRIQVLNKKTTAKESSPAKKERKSRFREEIKTDDDSVSFDKPACYDFTPQPENQSKLAELPPPDSFESESIVEESGFSEEVL